jgi:hypothetical protein
MSRNKDIGYCEACHKQFAYDLIHNGFNDSAYAYCDKCGETCLLSAWYDKIPKAAKLRFHQVIDDSVEPFLRRCGCGGKFKKGASPRCPHCYAELSAVAATEYIEKNAPGAKMGWRWQQNWEGLYCIIVEDKVVTDNWKGVNGNESQQETAK